MFVFRCNLSSCLAAIAAASEPAKVVLAGMRMVGDVCAWALVDGDFLDQLLEALGVQAGDTLRTVACID